MGAGNSTRTSAACTTLVPAHNGNSRRRALLQVEQWYVQQGYLLPTFHQGYWFGLVSNSTSWPQFRWSDNSVPVLGGSSGCLDVGCAINHGACQQKW